ncbi:hypothetical protein ACIBCM_11955 [Streptomyces sp. NPDC051018]|uniref:hypothetical protein n=1 Tax=Streptomyces sp. NPDC051018 TaxID=3365639 RepID=UPI00378BCE4E
MTVPRPPASRTRDFRTPMIMFRGSGFALYGRSRALPATLAALAGTALAAAVAAYWLRGLPDAGQDAREPVVLLAPLLAAAALGTGLHTPSEELDRTGVRRWWPRRLLHVLALTALASAALAAAVPGDPDQYGAPAMVRNVLGATGVTAAAATVLGARLSWLPMTVCTGAIRFLGATGADGGAPGWIWPLHAGPGPAAWVAAGAVFAAGAVLFAACGARRESL